MVSDPLAEATTHSDREWNNGKRLKITQEVGLGPSPNLTDSNTKLVEFDPPHQNEYFLSDSDL